MTNSEKPGPKARRSYEKLDRESQYKQTVRIIEQHPEEAAERAAMWNAFVAEHPDFAEVPMTFDAVKKWAKDNKVDLPYASTIMRDRDLADTLASDKARAEGTWVARTRKAKPEAAPAEAATPAAASEPTATEEVAPKNRRKKRELTAEEKEDAALAADYGFSYNYRREPVLGERLPLAGAPARRTEPSTGTGRTRPVEVLLYEDPRLEEERAHAARSRQHWKDNHARTEAYRQRNASEGYLPEIPKPGDENFVPETPGEFAAHNKALFSSSQDVSSSAEPRATIAGMEKPPRATPAPAETGELSSKETAERYLDYYDHRDDAPKPAAESGVLTSQETAERYLDHYDNRDASSAAPAETQPAATPAEVEPAATPDLVVPQEEVDRHNTEKGIPPAAATENNPLTDETPVVGEDIPHIEAAKKLKERSAELDQEAAKLGEKEGSWIRNLGEKYNSLNWKWKVALGAALGGAAAAGIAFGSPVALAAGAFGTAGQRVFGGLGMFVKAENYLENKASANEKDEAKWKRQLKAAAAALAYTGLATFGIKKAIDYTADWLGHMWPGDAAEGIQGQPVSEIADKLPTAPEAPGVTVEATQGKGYEYMTKRLWEQLHGADSTLVDQDFITQHPESDAAKLWNAPADKIDAVVHQIATERGFYQPDAENVLIKPNSVLGFTPDGSLRLGVPGGSEVIDAAPDAPVTLPYNPEVSAPEAAPEVAPIDTAADHAGSIDSHGEVSGAESTTPDHSFVNKHGIEVFDSQPNLYTDGSGKELYVYGGNAEQQAGFIEKFYSNPQNADKVIYGSDQAGETRVAWRLTNGQLTPAAVPKTSFLGFGRGFEKAPSPDDLRMLIK